MQHIEKSGWKAGEYVGFCGGRVFKVMRVLAGKRTIGWEAHAGIASRKLGGCNYLLAPSLAGLDRQLSELADHPEWTV